MSSSTSPVCLITGGSSGVGLATAARFARGGWRILICGRDATRLETARQGILRAVELGDVRTAVADLADPQAPLRLAETVIRQLGRVDVLVNNAAMAPLAPIDEIADAQIQQTIDLNVRGVYLMTRAVWPAMKEQGSGVVINISSTAAIDPFPGFSLYGATKAWIELFTLAIAREGRASGIRAYCVRPGAVETPMLRELFSDFPEEQAVAPEDVAEIIWTACQPGMRHSSGQVFGLTRQC